MDEVRILLTGDFWHQDFSNLIRHITFPITLIPFEKVLANVDAAHEFSLVVIAQTRRGQFAPSVVEGMQSQFANVPVVCLAGSWCEGETRSGFPVPGLIRVYWHQWQGRFNKFLQQLEHQSIATWHMPRVCSLADRALNDSELCATTCNTDLTIGISSLTADGYFMLQDACSQTCSKTIWIEQQDAADEAHVQLASICVEANSMNSQLNRRLSDLKLCFPQVPLIVLLNFPRQYDFQAARRAGVSEIISKPFELADLRFAIQRVTAADAA